MARTLTPLERQAVALSAVLDRATAAVDEAIRTHRGDHVMTDVLLDIRAELAGDREQVAT